ncbi:hypothetical protein [Streptomyces caniscabiei]|uniref:DUF317 domain-containing protein n=1 Tax=Streptomyces caniscabiei TaxID=2746961 RepID=A0ABU4MJV3_9ACTN|nr:hypothetical protein [Streptomyces caniscabiei]MBE4735149.1 hypothetical protein [Streptomyces caniscabiei]MBE4754283.1 hypothetical protein [Streptomyces caniscabiei]MBE4767875.1 hypothetical protein [Streptomyces caniscabiei]MBE4784331.1 hypothetical protein [Streptomyces caniscabiei]MBE4791170.1 hypothetical protein [Streptomyces caniscabiei]
MTNLSIDRSPDQLAEELKGLEYVDWPAVWAGPPNPGQALDDWCALFGWKPTSAERVLTVRSTTGQTIALWPEQEASWAPIKQLSWTSWDMWADDTSENDLVLTQAAATWGAYVAAARPVLGEPVFAGAWDDPAFPEPPHDQHWLMPRGIRLEDMDPYRMAVWRESGPEGRITVLTVSLGAALEPGELRSARINIRCYPPEAV